MQPEARPGNRLESQHSGCPAVGSRPVILVRLLAVHGAEHVELRSFGAEERGDAAVANVVCATDSEFASAVWDGMSETFVDAVSQSAALGDFEWAQCKDTSTHWGVAVSFGSAAAFSEHAGG